MYYVITIIIISTYKIECVNTLLFFIFVAEFN